MKNSKKIHEIIEKHGESILKEAFDAPWTEIGFYSKWLAGTAYFTTHTVKLLELGARGTENEELKESYSHHIEEEVGHDNIAKSDLKNLGFDLKDFNETEIVQKIYNDIYELMEKDVCALQGYALLLETLSAKALPTITEITTAKWGVDSSKFIKLHGIVDQDHHKETEVLDSLTDDQFELIAEAVKISAENYSLFLMECVSEDQVLEAA